MKIIVVGCGRFGAELASRLFQAGHEVSIIDRYSKAFARLPNNFAGRLNEGDAINQDILHRAGIEEADTLAVVTDSDVVNAVVGHLAQSYYHVANVVARNHDPAYRPIFEAYGLQSVSAMSWGAQRVEELLYDKDARTVFSAGNGEVELYEFILPEALSGSTVAELLSGTECLPVSVTRAGRAVLPSMNMALNTGDVLHVSATQAGSQSLRQRLQVTLGQ